MHKGRMWVIIGVCLIISAGILTGRNMLDGYRKQEISESVVQQLDIVSQDVISNEILMTTGFNVEMPEKDVDGNMYIGTITIPALSLELPVLSNWSDAGLWISPARYTGSAYTDDMILCAHNSYSHFGYLYWLNTDDTVIFTDVDGNVFEYALFEKLIIDENDVEHLKDGDWDLTLFTCTFDGLQRRVFRFDRID
ncbi:MAG: sortase [Bulleidia sp.]